MALSIKHAEADRLARRISELTGEGLTDAVVIALKERLARLERSPEPGLAERLLALGDLSASLPVLDPRTPDEFSAMTNTVCPRDRGYVGHHGHTRPGAGSRAIH